MLIHNENPFKLAAPVSLRLKKELLAEGLLVECKQVKDANNPRGNSMTTWVGVDEPIPENYIHSKSGLHSNGCVTIADVVDLYFDEKGLKESDFVWWPVVVFESRDFEDEIDYACYGVSQHKKADLCARSKGFMYIDRLKAIELCGISIEEPMDNADEQYPNVDDEIKRLLDQELDSYTAWELSDVYDIILSTIDGLASKKTEKVFNVKGGVENAIILAKRRLAEMQGLPA